MRNKLHLLNNNKILTWSLFNYPQVICWAIDQKREDELCAEVARIKVPFHFWTDQGDDRKGNIKKWSQPNGKKSVHTKIIVVDYAYITLHVHQCGSLVMYLCPFLYSKSLTLYIGNACGTRWKLMLPYSDVAESEHQTDTKFVPIYNHIWGIYLSDMVRVPPRKISKCWALFFGKIWPQLFRFRSSVPTLHHA